MKPETGSRSSLNKLILLVYFVSGFCSLVDQVVWVRLLKLSLGNTVYASSVVVSVFLGGLAIGAFIGARISDRLRRPLRTYAALELAISLAALAFPFALRGTDNLYRQFFLAQSPTSAELLLVHVAVSALLLLVPTILMGITLPLLASFFTTWPSNIGRSVGSLYAFNTLGAATGCFLAGFVLIRFVGVMGTLYVAACVNLLVALAAWILSRQTTSTSVVQSSAVTPTTVIECNPPHAPVRLSTSWWQPASSAAS